MTNSDFPPGWEDIIFGDEDWSTSSRPGTPPLHQTSNYVFRTVQDMQKALKHEDETPFYTRGANPTLQLVAAKLAALEGMEAGLLFASGSAAIAAAILSQVTAGDQILSVESPYSWTRKLIEQFCARLGVAHEFCSAAELANKINDRTRIIFLESPNSWTFETQPLSEITAVAQKNNITTILDNSYATPLLQPGAEQGIDIVVHSATKYLGGHSDIVAGVLCASKKTIRDIFNGPYMTLGGILSPFEAWLLLRSLRTLPIRLREIQQTTKQIVDFLLGHPKIRKVHFPGAGEANENAVPKTGLFSIDLDTDDVTAVEHFSNSLERFKLGPSWGSYESLAFPAIATIGSMNYDHAHVVVGRIRLSVGLQSAHYLIEDLENALKPL